jgi:glycogen debranching enzyme
MNYLAGRMGKAQEANYWEQMAETLRENFLKRFWWEEEQTLFLALDGAKKPCDVVSSNAGQCLWTGIVPEEKAGKIMERLMREDMYSGWGIRTLSSRALRYNPMSYHNGSVWPHDTALVGMGFAQHGGKAETGLLLKNLYEASQYYEKTRLPELYCGFARRSGYGPIRYPVACSPQAWAAGAPFLLLSALLGFQPDAEHSRLTLDRPTLPDWLKTIELSDMRLGENKLHLRLVRSGNTTEVHYLEENEVDVQVL